MNVDQRNSTHYVIRYPNYEAIFNIKLMNITIDRGNSTHYGRTTMDVFQDINDMILAVKTDNNRISDYTFNLCDFYKNRRVKWVAFVFENYFDRTFHPDLLRCPVKKGFYIAQEARPYVNVMDLKPTYIPIRGKLAVTIILKMKNGRKLSHLLTVTEIFTFD